MPSSSGSALWSHASSADLTSGLLTPFTWSILSQSAERAVRSHYRALGYELPADATIWRCIDGRAYVNTTALTAANQAVFGSQVGPVGLGQRLFGRGGSRQASALRQEIEQAPAVFDRIDRWWAKVQDIQWRQATILQIMEEIEPHVEAVLTVRDHVTTGLGNARRQITQWVAEWMPGSSDSLFDELFAGLDGHEGIARYAYDLARLEDAARQDGAALAYLRAGDWQAGLPEGVFCQDYQRFLSTYGRWAQEPLEAACPRWSEAPEGLLAHLAQTLSRPPGPTPQDPEDARRRRSLAADHVSRQIGPLRRRQFEPVFEQLQRLVDLLPPSRAALVTAMAGARVWALGAAREATLDGRLAAEDDVFLLELEELKQMMTGEWNNPDQVRPLVEERRTQQAAWAAVEPAAVVEA